MVSYLLLVIAGLLGGFMAGLIGIGGGIIYVVIIPEALHYFQIPEADIAQYTIANSVFAILFASASANYQHFKTHFYKKEIILIGILSVVSSLLTLTLVVNTHLYSFYTFNIVTLIMLCFLLYSTLNKVNRQTQVQSEQVTSLGLSITGMLSGMVSSLSGLGGGVVVIPILNSFMKVDIKKASVISSGVIMITSFFVTIFSLFEHPKHHYGNYTMGYIIFPVAIALTVGVVIASKYGVEYSKKLSSKTITYIYASFLLIVIIKKAIEVLF